MASYLIQIYDPGIEPLIKSLASEDMRSIGNEVAWLIRKEYYARHPKTLAELNSQDTVNSIKRIFEQE